MAEVTNIGLRSNHLPKVVNSLVIEDRLKDTGANKHSSEGEEMN